jgi:hypothetical protein
LRWWNSKLSFSSWGTSSTILYTIYLTLAIIGFNSKNSFYWTKIFICINSFSRSFKSIFEIELIDCLWWSISHWFCKTVFEIFLTHYSTNSNRMSAIFFILRIKNHKSRILSDRDTQRISLNLLWRSWRKLVTLCL